MTASDELNAFFNQTVLTFGQKGFSLGNIIVACVLALVLLGFYLIYTSGKAAKARAAREAAALERAREAEAKMAELVASQNELTGRMQTMSEIFSTRQGDMMRAVNERLEGMSGRIGQSISETTKNTQESLTKLQERLAVIDTAQNNIMGLAGQVVELQNILSNKQTRGAFGEGRMQQIVQDGLPHGAYEFQATLSNNSRPDCIIHMPNDTPPLVIDAKFPLESWHRIREAETPEQAKIAAQAFKRDVEVHLKAISEKYFLKGETQDMAFMFVPSESIFAEIHENFESLVQKAHKARVVIVSPSLLMLSIQVMQSVLKDVRMREQAHLIQREIVTLIEDVGRLDDRVRKLDNHFRQAQKDVGDILISTEKVTKRGTKITELEFEEPGTVESEKRPKLKAVE
ncbi:MAG: DNA recombination protein RmuC [Rhizobiaceae bacterium]|nr:DNA recombination protein RmuC [Rhizobiaceae bacterium]